MIDDIFGLRNDAILCYNGLVDSVNGEYFRGELTKLKDKWKGTVGTVQQIYVATASLSGSKTTKQVL